MKTYSEMQQAIYFKTARDLREVAATILSDCTQDVELTGSTAGWALERAQKIATRADEIEQDGFDIAVASRIQETNQRKSSKAFRGEVIAFKKRAAEAMERVSSTHKEA